MLCRLGTPANNPEWFRLKTMSLSVKQFAVARNDNLSAIIVASSIVVEIWTKKFSQRLMYSWLFNPSDTASFKDFARIVTAADGSVQVARVRAS
jgi:hypothetical protein